jgi:alkylation response protein AidB-like acyl-CoA dehydrogenase
LQARAVPEGEAFIVNGQKTWTSRAHLADWIFVLVRTDTGVQKQRGISFILVDMKSPGVSIRPIKQIDGQAEFFETFFDNVKVPAENMVGKINEGWTMAKHLLGHERASTGGNVDGHLLDRLKSLASRYEQDGRPLMKGRDFRDRLARLEMDADCLRYTRYRMLTALMQGKAPGPESSIFKLYQSELVQRICDLALEAMGPDSMRWYDKTMAPDAYEFPMATNIHRAMSIYSGSNEVQRNIIAKQVLGLPD